MGDEERLTEEWFFKKREGTFQGRMHTKGTQNIPFEFWNLWERKKGQYFVMYEKKKNKIKK